MTPIVFFGYRRPAHTERCLRSLAACPEARQTELIAYLDAPEREEDRELTDSVRDCVERQHGFQEVHITERSAHVGLAGNIISGVTEVLNRFERVIVVEDDLVVSPAFLAYMNAGLETYRNAFAVFSISGYNYPGRILRLPRAIGYDAYFIGRNSSWGWGTWRDRWRLADWEINDYQEFCRDASRIRAFSQDGADLPRLLNLQMTGSIDSWAIRWTYAHFRNHALSLVPHASYVNNIGHDGSGTHTRGSRRYHNRVLNENLLPKLPPHPYVDPGIARRHRVVHQRTALYRAARWLYHKILESRS